MKHMDILKIITFISFLLVSFLHFSSTSYSQNQNGDGLVVDQKDSSVDLIEASDDPEEIMNPDLFRSAKAKKSLEQLGADKAVSNSEKKPLPHSLSPWRMFIDADIIVKGVIISLCFASFMAWNIWFFKLMSLAVANFKLKRDHRALMKAIDLATGLSALGKSRSPVAIMANHAIDELKLSGDANFSASGIKERVSSHMERIEYAAGRRISSGTNILASIGSVSPFVGLFGTVWGIMNSFISISESQTTNLAVVAPGIAEALLATAIGLVAAIPAVVFYNHLAKSIGSYKALVGDATALIERIVSRDLDRIVLSKDK